ncbi:cysteine--tRNA ligase [Halobacteriovorax marinus]|uniref:Cysteine--tRNA ligase n=1 Tax=Halobacteriovorax marinus TaxID=97084 RepID=A0A1Y5F6U6_9BACT|nr:cysteine--tRNA ligase [Halobacteriovorax marinus]
MPIKLYNTLSNTKENFVPIEEGKVRLYLCGPTVYDLLHIGNFRGAIFFNLVRNWFELSGNEVTYVYNYTDVDDKIIKKANEEGVDATVISERFIAEFEKDFNRLGLKKHTHNPKVTEFMDEIISYVETLVKNDKAYVIDGEVFFSIDNFPEYGKLSNKNLDDLQAGQRVEVDSRKRNPYDFVLWKPSKEGEPHWTSPWGEGRPGWHIECSAMIKSILGNTIDIHGGGIDLIFPHHENEIAQGEGCNCEKYCNYWMHNEFINMKDEKMSKSIGNVITGRSFMDQYHPEILKFLMFSAHYRSVLNMSDDKIHQSISGLRRVYDALSHALVIENTFNESENGKVNKTFAQLLKTSDAKIKKALDDDFNTGETVAAIFEVVRAFNALNLLKKQKDPNSLPTTKAFKEWILKYGDMLALFKEEPTSFLADIDQIMIKEKNIDIAIVEALIKSREEARANKDWAAADVARDELHAMGIDFQETSDGVKWNVKV